MKQPLTFKSRAFSLLGCLLFIAACTSNAPFRDQPPTDCPPEGCASSFIELHGEEGYDLAFVEFSERGNVFDRQRMDAVLKHVAEQSKADASNPDQGAAVIVFIHGWHHNAGPENNNVASFRELLKRTAPVVARNNRHLIGVYVGWRGASVTIPGIRMASYWERKTVAHQVGKGGVTELLLRLENTVIDDQNPNRNLFVITAHSFGSAIALSALNEIMLERVINTDPLDANDPNSCVYGNPFGHGVALFNPAIEANEMIQLKEQVAAKNFCPRQDRLMHVISSDADAATNKAFILGQWAGGLNWRKTDFDREFENGNDIKTINFRESALDTITVGNYPPFRTGRMTANPEGDPLWNYASCVGSQACLDEDEKPGHIPVSPNEPLAFIQTDSSFIKDHNDVFKGPVIAYIAAITVEAQHKRSLQWDLSLPDNVKAICYSQGDFDFGTCFGSYLDLFCQEGECRP